MMAGVRDGCAAPLRDRWQVIGVMAPLIVLGGLGFPVLLDCARYSRSALRRLLSRLRRRTAGNVRNLTRPQLSLHSRIVLTASVVLIGAGAGGLLLIEPLPGSGKDVVGRHPLTGPGGKGFSDWPRMPLYKRMREAVFQSISARTAGFNTIDMNELSAAGKMGMCGLMVIGGSPAGTAGGMKTVTFALLLISVYAVVRRRAEIEAFHRSISTEMIRRAVTLAVLYAALVGMVTLLLCVAMRREAFIDLLVESCSACGTVGLSTGVTKRLNEFGKFVVIGAMFIGRVGPLTLLLALTSGLRRVEYAYPTENVIIG